MNKEKKICSISFYVFEMKFPKRSDNENVFSINDISINKIDIDLSCFHSSIKRKIWFNEEQKHFSTLMTVSCENARKMWDVRFVSKKIFFFSLW